MLEIIKNVQGVYIFNEPSLDLMGCISIDKCNRNYTAIGGTRLAQYPSLEEAVRDSVYLAKTMSKKCKIADIPFIGGKAVILKPKHIKNIQKFFEYYGMIINSLNGSFITGCDVGVNSTHMNIVQTKTKYITGLSKGLDRDYLSYFTALGIYESMKICLKRTRSIDSLKNIHVVVQGVGKVGRYLVEILYSQKARITISDIAPETVKQITSLIDCNVIEEKDILKTECDIFSPCALGGIINESNRESLKCKLICGAANNQIYEYKLLNRLSSRNIIFIPDWICNVGGTIYAAFSYLGNDIHEVTMKVKDTIERKTHEFLDLNSKSNLYTAALAMLDNSHTV
jgi:leucine dehydrogenase